MLELDQLPHDLNALVDSYRDKRVAYKYERRHVTSRLYVETTTSYYVDRILPWSVIDWTRSIEPGLVVCYAFHSRLDGYNYTYRWLSLRSAIRSGLTAPLT